MYLLLDLLLHVADIVVGQGDKLHSASDAAPQRHSSQRGH